MKRFLEFIPLFFWLFCIPFSYSFGISSQAVADISKRVHVYCECHNTWINGSVANFAHVELRDGTSFGPVISDAAVEVNGQKLSFDSETQTYKGNIGKVEQWQEIPILIQTVDKRKVRGHVVVVYMVEFTEPKPLVDAPSSQVFPVSWKYSEGSMHTADLEIFKDEGEPVGIEVRGNKTTLDLNRLGIKIDGSESIHLRVLPPWTSNFEFSGNLTRRSKVNFITSATLTVRLVD